MTNPQKTTTKPRKKAVPAGSTSGRYGVNCPREDDTVREWERRLGERLQSENFTEELELSDLIDSQALQSLMDDFYRVAGIPMSIIDLKGNVLVGVGWQDICMTFHRAHPETCRHCIESDILLSGAPVGEFRLYKCPNNMWDVATPIVVCGRHMGNVFSGQFFFDDEAIDYDLFRSQAQRYGFDEEEYFAALESVPRLSRSRLDAGMSFFIKIADLISTGGYNNIQLARSLVERDALMVSLRESRQDLNRAQSVSHTGSWRLDVRRNELAWSEETYRIFGIPEGSSLTYEKFLSFVHPEDRDDVDRKWSAALGGEPYEIEHRIIVDDIVKWVREKAELEFDEEGALLGGFGTVQDITERKRAEEVLRENEERQSFLLELSDRLRPLSDAQNMMTAASEVLAGRFGLSSVGYCEILEDGEAVIAHGEYSDGRLPNLDCFCLHQPSDSDFLRSLRAGDAVFYDSSIDIPVFGNAVRTGESIPPVAWAAIPLLKDSRLIAYLYAFYANPRPWPGKERSLMREVAERTWGAVQRARAETALRESEQRYKSLNAELELRVTERTAELERKNRDLEEFAFVASHDLSEPLRKIQTFGSLLEAKPEIRLDVQSRDFVSRMIDAANRMRELLGDLLQYSRIGSDGLECRPVRMTDVVRDVTNDLEVAIREVGADVEIGPLPAVKGEPHQLRQLFQNLLANALKYHRTDVKPTIKIYGEESGSTAHLFVEDNGIGFDEKYSEKIFQPFKRLHGRNEYPGTGVGLAICKKIVERHGGTITARSILGKGSTFVIRLPAWQDTL